MRHILFAGQGVSGQMAPCYPYTLWERGIKGDLCAWREVFIATEQLMTVTIEPSVKKNLPYPLFSKEGHRKIQLVSGVDAKLAYFQHPPSPTQTYGQRSAKGGGGHSCPPGGLENPTSFKLAAVDAFFYSPPGKG